MHVTKIPPLIMGRREGTRAFLRADGRTWTEDYAKAAEFAPWYARACESQEQREAVRLTLRERADGWEVKAYE
jgi:hypothetical protein